MIVHQIWLGKKRKQALESSYSAEELNVVQRDIGRLAHYTVEMGGGVDLLETALRIPPWEPLYRLSADELHRMRLSTVDAPFDRAPRAAQPMSPTSSLATVGRPGDSSARLRTHRRQAITASVCSDAGERAWKNRSAF